MLTHWLIVFIVVLLIASRGDLLGFIDHCAIVVRALRTGDFTEMARRQEAHMRRLVAGEWKLRLFAGALAVVVAAKLLFDAIGG